MLAPSATRVRSDQRSSYALTPDIKVDVERGQLGVAR